MAWRLCWYLSARPVELQFVAREGDDLVVAVPGNPDQRLENLRSSKKMSNATVRTIILLALCVVEKPSLRPLTVSRDSAAYAMRLRPASRSSDGDGSSHHHNNTMVRVTQQRERWKKPSPWDPGREKAHGHPTDRYDEWEPGATARRRVHAREVPKWLRRRGHEGQGARAFGPRAAPGRLKTVRGKVDQAETRPTEAQARTSTLRQTPERNNTPERGTKSHRHFYNTSCTISFRAPPIRAPQVRARKSKSTQNMVSAKSIEHSRARDERIETRPTRGVCT